MPLPRNNWGNSWPLAVEAWVQEVLANIVGNPSSNQNIPETNRGKLDTNGDGNVNLTDVITLLRVQTGLTEPSDNVVSGEFLARHGYNVLRRGRYYNTEVANQTYNLGFEEINNPGNPGVDDHLSTVHGGTAMSMNMVRKEFKLRDTDVATTSSVSEFRGADPGIPASGQGSFKDYYGTSGNVLGLIAYEITRSDKQNNGYQTVVIDSPSEFVPGNPSTMMWKGGQEVGWGYRIYIGYKNGDSGTAWRGDFQIDDINLRASNNNRVKTWTFSTSSEGWTQLDGSADIGQAYNARGFNDDIYDVINEPNWISIGNGTTAARWNRDSGGTPSNSTGVASDANDAGSYYLYAETTSPTNYSDNFWMKSPLLTYDTGEWSKLAWQWACYSPISVGQDNQGAYAVYIVAEPVVFKQPIAQQIATGGSSNSTTARRARFPIGWTYPSGSYHVGTGPTGVYNFGRVPEGTDFRLYLRYQNGDAGTSYRGDFQVGQIQLLDGTGSSKYNIGFGSVWSGSSPKGGPWYTFSNNTYPNIVNWEDTLGKWSAMADGISNTTNYQWNKKSGGTPSSQTGVDPPTGSYEPYIYAETSGTGVSLNYYWTRSRVYTVPTGTQNGQGITNMDIWYFAYGDNIKNGALDVFVEFDNQYKQDTF
jgi:hypothetical protein